MNWVIKDRIIRFNKSGPFWYISQTTWPLPIVILVTFYLKVDGLTIKINTWAAFSLYSTSFTTVIITPVCYIWLTSPERPISIAFICFKYILFQKANKIISFPLFHISLPFLISSGILSIWNRMYSLFFERAAVRNRNNKIEVKIIKYDNLSNWCKKIFYWWLR